jgi:hypothetical protein
MKSAPKKFDIYSELFPASSATVIGAGLITVTMGSASAGVAFILAGIAVGVAGPVAQSLRDQRHKKIAHKK